MTSIWINIIPIIIGGALAITGGIASQYLTYRLSMKREAEKLINDKAEELISLLYEHQNWLHRESQRLVFGNDIAEQADPLDKVSAINSLYFPELAKPMHGFLTALKPIINFNYKLARARGEGHKEWLAEYEKLDHEPIYAAYLAAFHELISETVKAARSRGKK